MTGAGAGLDGCREAQLLAARRLLTAFVIERAELTAAAVGYGWIARSDAPNEFASLQARVERSRRDGAPLPISDAHNDSIYLTPEANVAFRFWHDANHVEQALTFDLVDELELAIWHLSELEQAGVTRHSLPWRLLHADLIGQNQLMALVGQFPGDQLRFVRHCVSAGFDDGLLAEARRIRPWSPAATAMATDCSPSAQTAQAS